MTEGRAPTTRRSAAMTLLSAAAAALVLAASCGGTVPVDGGGVPQQKATVVRLALAPDPVWAWIEGSGAKKAWEQAKHVSVEVSHPFEVFAAFSGGHADVVLAPALDLPILARHSGRDATIIAKHSSDRSFIGVRRTSRAETLDDLVERRVLVDTSGGSTKMWRLIAWDIHALDFSVGGADFDIVVAEPGSIAELVMSGDADACVCRPDLAAKHLASGRMRPLYGGVPASGLYPPGGPVTISEALVADRAWAEANPAAVEAIVGMWNDGLAYWAGDSSGGVDAFRHLFAARTEQEVEWMQAYTAQNSWYFAEATVNDQDSQGYVAMINELEALQQGGQPMNTPQAPSVLRAGRGLKRSEETQ